ncbi:type II toxin-antitoxin system Phd/YefM family antitoxin [Sinomonas atrocyanea]|nr:type II toxin-antitoxin system Phd/YefM family antitoxin [Sinomonas atrocyanea]
MPSTDWNDREEVVVTRPNGKNVVIVSQAEYSSLMETAYLLSNPRNAARLLSSIESLKPYRH